MSKVLNLALVAFFTSIAIAHNSPTSKANRPGPEPPAAHHDASHAEDVSNREAQHKEEIAALKAQHKEEIAALEAKYAARLGEQRGKQSPMAATAQWSTVFEQQSCKVTADSGKAKVDNSFHQGCMMKYSINGKAHAVYKRLTPMKGSIYDLFTLTWKVKADGNKFNQDFKLYDDEADAEKDQHPWSSCNGEDPGVGFPRDCGKKGGAEGSWMAHNSKRSCGAQKTVQLDIKCPLPVLSKKLQSILDCPVSSIDNDKGAPARQPSTYAHQVNGKWVGGPPPGTWMVDIDQENCRVDPSNSVCFLQDSDGNRCGGCYSGQIVGHHVSLKEGCENPCAKAWGGTVACPEGIGPKGYLSNNQCVKWGAQIVVRGETSCAPDNGMTGNDHKTSCTKAIITRQDAMSRSAGVVMYKRVVCENPCANKKLPGCTWNACAVFKVGMCVDVGEDVFKRGTRNEYTQKSCEGKDKICWEEDLAAFAAKAVALIEADSTAYGCKPKSADIAYAAELIKML